MIFILQKKLQTTVHRFNNVNTKVEGKYVVEYCIEDGSGKAKSIMNVIVEKEAEDIFNTQTLLENATREDIIAQNNPKMLKHYDMAIKNADKRAIELLRHKPELIIKKILNSQNTEHKSLKDEISQVYNSVDKKRLLYRNNSPYKSVSFGIYGNYGNVGNYGNYGNIGSCSYGGFSDVTIE